MLFERRFCFTYAHLWLYVAYVTLLKIVWQPGKSIAVGVKAISS